MYPWSSVTKASAELAPIGYYALPTGPSLYGWGQTSQTISQSADPKLNERFANIGGAPIGGSPADFHKLITDEIAKWHKVIRIANINPA